MTPEQLTSHLEANNSQELLRLWRLLASATGRDPHSVTPASDFPPIADDGLGHSLATRVTTGKALRRSVIRVSWSGSIPANAPQDVEIAGIRFPVISEKQADAAEPFIW